MNVSGYPKVWNVGHGELVKLLFDDVLVEEKIDGSQFSFCRSGEELFMRSKNAEIFVDAPEKLFAKAVETVKELAPLLVSGWVYRAEYLRKPKHNVLAYSRTPFKNLILFDVEDKTRFCLRGPQKAEEAARLGLECVPTLYYGKLKSIEELKVLLEKESILGGVKLEGVVIKNYTCWGRDGKFLAGKYVSEAFKEIHTEEWKKQNPQKADVVQALIVKFSSEARWQKAVQHLTETSRLENSPRDIGKLMLAVQQDVEEECTEEIMQRLFDWAWPQIKRAVCGGLPQWYKEQLLKSQFEKPQ